MGLSLSTEEPQDDVVYTDEMWVGTWFKASESALFSTTTTATTLTLRSDHSCKLVEAFTASTVSYTAPCYEGEGKWEVGDSGKLTVVVPKLTYFPAAGVGGVLSGEQREVGAEVEGKTLEFSHHELDRFVDITADRTCDICI